MELVPLVLILVAAVIGIMIAVAPLFIWSLLKQILDETKRHNRKIEAKVDIIHDILRDISESGVQDE